MKKIFQAKMTLLFLVVSPFLFGQCPENLNINQYLKSKDSLQCEKAILLLENCSGQKDSLALLYHYLGVWSYLKKDYGKAISFNLKAIDIRVKNELKNDESSGKTHHNLGMCYMNNDDYKKAKKHLIFATNIYKSIDSDREIRSLYGLSLLYNKQGDYSKALQFLDLGNQKARKFKDTLRLHKSYIQYGIVLHEKKRYGSAIDSLVLAVLFFKNKQSSKFLAQCYINLARSHYELKEYKKSIFYGELIVNELSQFVPINLLGISMNNLGLAYLKLGDIKKARSKFKAGAELGKIHNLSNLVAQSFNNIGEGYLLSQQEEKALVYYHNALKAELKVFSAESVLINPTKNTLNTTISKLDALGYLSDKGKALLLVFTNTKEQKYLTTCLETYKLCDYLIDLIRQEHTEQSSKLFWREKVMPIYEKAIEVSYVAKDYESTFFFFEKSRAVLLLDAIVNTEALNAIQNDSLIQREKQLTKARLAIQAIVDNGNQNEKNKALEKLIQSNNELDELIVQLSKDYPSYHTFKYSTDVISPSDVINSQLNNGKTALLHYFLGEEKSWLYVLSNEKTIVKELGTAQKTQYLVANYLAFFENSAKIINNPKGYGKAAFELYEHLIAPAELENIENLIIIPDGILGFVPFESLVTVPNESGNLSEMQYLIKDYSLRLSFSATILGKQNKQLASTKGLLAFAPFSNKEKGGKYPALPFSEDELFMLEQSIGGQYFKGNKASKTQFLNQIADCSVVHLSTHAVANEADGQPYIVFSDTILTLRELYGLSLPTNLVVLSACQTNIGEVKSGEGIFSLSRGFTHAGAKSVIASLWNVNASSTGEIFPVFYQNLKGGSPKSIALREAKLKYINAPSKLGQIKTPYDWGGFVLIGNNENISLTPSHNRWMIGGALFCMIFVVFIKNLNDKN